jgi:hypothetical protein
MTVNARVTTPMDLGMQPDGCGPHEGGRMDPVSWGRGRIEMRILEVM